MSSRADDVISATKLGKRLGGKRILERVELRLERGGLLLVTGPNGSGKTTLLRILAGLDAPTAGTVTLPARARVGYLGHEPLVYRELTPRENLELFARLYGLGARAERVQALLERFALWEVRDQRVQTLSRGMRQRLGLCRALLHQPTFLVLDEPFNALDVSSAALLDETLVSFLADGAIVVATHDPARVEALATATLTLG